MFITSRYKINIELLFIRPIKLLGKTLSIINTGNYVSLKASVICGVHSHKDQKLEVKLDKRLKSQQYKKIELIFDKGESF